MKKRVISLLLALIVCAGLFVPVMASDELVLVGDEPAASLSDGSTGFIRDQAGLMSAGLAEKLEAEAQSYADAYGCGVYLLTTDTIGGAGRREYAKQYYIDNDLGVGSYKNGILFLVAMESREYVTVTYGRNPEDNYDYGPGIQAFTDYGIQKLEDRVVSKMSDGDFDDAFSTYVSICGQYLEKWSQGEPVDVNTDRSKTIPLLITILVPLLIAFLVCLIFWSQMKTAVEATSADEYIPSNGFNLTRQIDQYTHTTVTRRHIERDHGSSGGGGGSSVDSGGFGGSSGGHF